MKAALYSCFTNLPVCFTRALRGSVELGAVMSNAEAAATRRTLEGDLIQRVQLRDETAFAELVKLCEKRVYSAIYGTLRKHEDADDIAQQVFAKVWFGIRDFDQRSSLITWIYKIAVNECYDHLRKGRVRKLVYESQFAEEEWEKAQNSRASADPQVTFHDSTAQRDLIVKLLSRLGKEDRRLILLREMEGRSIEELARETGLNENTIKVKLFRARRALLHAAKRMERRAMNNRLLPCTAGM